MTNLTNVRREQLGSYTLSWPEGVFPLGSDALFLGNFATLRPGWRVCDLGTGSGALLLLLARREPGLSLTGVEIDPLSARTARDNLAANGLTGEILQCDLRTAPLPAGGFDLIAANPPYFPVGSGKSGGPARSEELCTLEELCAAAGRLVRNGGRFALCHRPGPRTGAQAAENGLPQAGASPSPHFGGGRPPGQAGIDYGAARVFSGVTAF